MQNCCQGKFAIHAGSDTLPGVGWKQIGGMEQHMNLEDADKRHWVMGTKLFHHLG